MASSPHIISLDVVAVVTIPARLAFVDWNRTPAVLATAICAASELPAMTKNVARMITAGQD